MEQRDFISILRRYQQGEATTEEKNLIDAWYASLKADAEADEIPDNAAFERYWSTIYAHAKDSKKRNRTKRFFPWYASGIAASVLIAIGFWFSSIDPREGKDNTGHLQESLVSLKQISNQTQNSQVVVLPDSSKVVLKPESNLRYASAFNKATREVYLEGEATFEVTHNARLPFYVYAKEVTTKVLGTSFIVKANKNEHKITVIVKTGKVSVSAKLKKEKGSTPAAEIILTPNQQMVYDKKENEISKSLVEAPQVIIPEEEVKHMRFEEAPVAEIFKALEKAYGVDIEFDEGLFSSCELTTVISNDDIYNRLNIICNAIGTSYTLQADRIVISSSGCKIKTQ